MAAAQLDSHDIFRSCLTCFRDDHVPTIWRYSSRALPITALHDSFGHTGPIGFLPEQISCADAIRVKIRRKPSTVHTGAWSIVGSIVARESPPRARSQNHISTSLSTAATATRNPSGDNRGYGMHAARQRAASHGLVDRPRRAFGFLDRGISLPLM